jgi:glycosyltransferase involved in cell wall biosynthesis
MRIGVITSSFPLNPSDWRAAAGFFVRDFAAALAELGHAVTVVTPDKTPGEKEEPPGVAVRWFPWLGGRKRLSDMKPYLPLDALAMASLFRQGARALDRLADEWHVDHVLAMWAVPGGVLARGLKRRRGVPYTTWCLGSDITGYGRNPLFKGVVRRVLRSSDLLLADGLRLAEEAGALAGRPCAFLPSSRRPIAAGKQGVALGEDGPRFLYVGRYAPVKGPDVLLEAMARFVARGNRGHLYLFGGGPLEGRLRHRAAAPDLRGRVTVGAFVEDETIAAYLDACDCLVIPSRMESIPLVLSDALKRGKPVVATDVGDMGLLLREQPAGLVVPPEDPAALAAAMAEMAAGDWSRFAPHVEALARRFDLAQVARQWLEQLQGAGRPAVARQSQGGTR